jgi:hypothetical protein
MENNHDISDELLAKYLSGKASPEERETVLAYLAENDERVEDFANMTAAVELQCDAEAAMIKRQRTVRRMWVGLSAAAVVIAAVCFFAVRNLLSTRPEDGGVLIAGNTDSATVNVVEPVENDSLMKEISNPQSAQPNWQGFDQKNYASKEAKTGYCTIVVPKNQEYRIGAKQSHFDFNWHTDAVRQQFELRTVNGQVVYSATADGYVDFNATEYRKYGQLAWNLKVTFADDSQWETGGDVVFE